MSFIDKFKIPTLLGLGIILFGTMAGVYLVSKDQVFFTQASPDIKPQNITFSNIEDQSITISWQTSQPITSFLTFGPSSPDEQTVLDDRDTNAPKPYITHYFTLKNLQPKTTYLFKIISGKSRFDILKFQTAAPLINQTNLNPIIGSVLDGEIPLNEGIVYLTISGAVIQSSLVKNLGNFLIPISKMSKLDLSQTYTPSEEDVGKITVISDKGQATAIFKLKSLVQPLPSLKVGENLDLAEIEASPTPAPPTKEELNKFDLNDDGQINANDHAIVLLNFGKNPKNRRADINSDRVVDQKDINLIAQKIRERGGSI